MVVTIVLTPEIVNRAAVGQDDAAATGIVNYDIAIVAVPMLTAPRIAAPSVLLNAKPKELIAAREVNTILSAGYDRGNAWLGPTCRRK